MTPAREAIALPCLFLTVVLLGGFRLAEDVKLVPPSLTALVLAMFLIGTMLRAGLLVPEALLHGSRTIAENLSGAVVLLTLFAAAAQAINLLLPDRGLLHAAFAIFFFCQLMTMNAARMERPALLRGFLVLAGSLFVLRFIVVEALYAPTGGLLQRVLRTLMSGATLGGVAYEPNAPVTGYVAFATLALFVIGLLLLPARPARALMVRSHPDASGLPTTFALVLVGLAAAMSAGCRGADPPPQGQQANAAPAPPAAQNLVSSEQREQALRRAQLWQAPPVPIAQANLKANPSGPGTFGEKDVVTCRLVVKAMGGTTPKFDCELPGGDVIRVKYGRGNPELHSEVATTRLLSALGFGADRMYNVERVRCAGCTPFPFQSLRCLAETKLERICFPRGIDYERTADFDYVVIERRLDGRRIESKEDEGWAWFELDRVDAGAGGAPRAHVDALKLLAMMINHWDNKAANQRLLCLPGGDLPDGGCSKPLAMMQDLGASFGPTKLDLHNWRTAPVWADARACRISMKHLPWSGGTFPDQQISEGGRQFLLNLLQQVSPAQLQDLFTGARIELSEGITAEGRSAAAWAKAFQGKVEQVREAGPCPASPPKPGTGN